MENSTPLSGCHGDNGNKQVGSTAKFEFITAVTLHLQSVMLHSQPVTLPSQLVILHSQQVGAKLAKFLTLVIKKCIKFRFESLFGNFP